MYRLKYKFQFNNDEDSCFALHSMIAQGWTLEGFIIEDGYIWFLLYKYQGVAK